MEFSKVIASRRSIRKFKKEPIPQETIDKLQQALNYAPSGNNSQPVKFVFVTDETLRKRLVIGALHQPGFADAPLIVVPCCAREESINAAIALDHLILAATDAGLGACWVAWMEREEIKKILGIPQNKVVDVIVPIGFADEAPEAKPRKPLSELICSNTYQ